MNFYSIIVTLSIVLLIYLVKKNVKKLSEEYFWKLVFYVFINSILGAKLFHILENFNFYLNNPNLIYLTKGYSILGAISFGYLTILYFEKNYKENHSNLLSNTFLYLPLIQAIGRIGNVFNNELLPFSLYEIFLNIINFILLKIFHKSNPNLTVYIFFLNYGLIRLIIESLKGNFGFLFLVSGVFIFYGFLRIYKLLYKV